MGNGVQEVTSEQLEQIRRALTLPESDVAEFEKRAAEILAGFAHFCPLHRQAKASWSPERVPEVKLEVTGLLVKEAPDPRTFEIVEIEASFGDRAYNLDMGGCRLLDALAEALALHPRLHGRTTTQAMRERVKNWCFVVLETNVYTNAVGHVLDALRRDVDVHEAWVLLADIDVEDSFPMGSVRICGIGSAQVNKWMSSLVTAGLSESTRPDIREHFERDWQGHTAAVYRCIADVDATKSAALIHTERACSLLRMVEPGNVSATQRSYLQPERLMSQMGVRSVLLDPERLDHFVDSETKLNPPCGIVVDKASFKEKWERGYLRALHELLSSAPQTEFQHDLLGALMVYSRHRLTSDPIEKLIFVFSGMEAVLVEPDKRIPKRFTLRKRLCGMFAGDESVRRNIAKVVNDAYELRSNYLHEGTAIRDRQIVEAFLGYAWLLFLRLIERHQRWRSVHELRLELDSDFKARFGEPEPAKDP